MKTSCATIYTEKYHEQHYNCRHYTFGWRTPRVKDTRRWSKISMSKKKAFCTTSEYWEEQAQHEADEMVSAQLCRLANLILVFLAFILYVTSFSSTGWLEDDYYAYGLWKKCDKNQTETDVCVTIGLANQEGKQHFCLWEFKFRFYSDSKGTLLFIITA